MNKDVKNGMDVHTTKLRKFLNGNFKWADR